MPGRIFTIGHSNHDIDGFIALLKRHGITLLADVRSHPYSRLYPQFVGETLQRALNEKDIRYVFLGNALGARSDNPDNYRDGRVQYHLVAGDRKFLNGILNLRKLAEQHTVVIMCAEKDPLFCHRTLLVGRQLIKQGVEVTHLLYDGTIEGNSASERRLLALLDLPETDLFRTYDETVAAAYSIQSERIAYETDPDGRTDMEIRR